MLMLLMRLKNLELQEINILECELFSSPPPPRLPPFLTRDYA